MVADQPLPNEDGSIQIVFNGEIYNFQEIRQELLSRGHRFRSRSDTETIVHLYEDEGVDAIRRLDGMFALAIWDGRLRRLVLARDRVGKKPLFVYRDRAPDRVRLGDQVVLRPPGRSRSTSIRTASRPISRRGHVPAAATIYRGVEQVPPATVLTARRARASTQPARYWQLPVGDSAVTIPREEAQRRGRRGS